jgi:hypothetical protein
MKVFSIDLASKHYRDFGWALLEVGTRSPEFVDPQDLGLSDPPDVQLCANAIEQFCVDEDVRVLLLDGPQGWRHPASPIEHMRLCERVLNTPGKTGLPGKVKPKTYLPYIQFSIDLFALLVAKGWALLTEDALNKPGDRLLVESFPSYAWRTLGLEKLPSKGRVRVSEIRSYQVALAEATGYDLPEKLSHDQLQAVVVLPAGEALALGDQNRLIMAGIDPIFEGGVVYEGWIPLPTRS